MTRKIATVAGVFLACDELDKSGKTWNRVDVRRLVGGGGYNVIDPLIKAWRKLKPFKKVAPLTPMDLMYQIAENINISYQNFMDQAQQQVLEQSKIFNETVAGLSESLVDLEVKLAQKEDECLAFERKIIDLQSKLQESQHSLLHLQLQLDNAFKLETLQNSITHLQNKLL
ncbi:MAG: DNA-binding protein [Pseudomonadales bacterium]